MRTAFCALLLMVAGSSVLSANRTGDGIYLRSEDESGPPIIDQDGRTVHLGAKQILEVESSELYALDNANTQFYLSLRTPYDENLNRIRHIMVADDIAFRQTGAFSSRDKYSGMSFTITAKEYAEQVARCLGTSVLYRRHVFRIAFVPGRQEFALGDDVTVTLQIENVGTNIVAFDSLGRAGAPRSNQYIFSAYCRGKQVRDVGTSGASGHIRVSRRLGPGQTLEETIELGKWFAFDQPGPYQVHGSYHLEFRESGDKQGRIIWEDYASADFTVTIVDAEDVS